MMIENTVHINLNAPQIDRRLEKAFLEEMVSHILPKPAQGEFSGGIGEQQFSSFLNREYAAALSQSLDLGLKVGRDG